MQKYIHYGHKEFIPELFTPIENQGFITKPSGGFWASPVDALRGWKQWNESEHFQECNEDNSFTFTLREGSNVTHLRSVKDMDSLPKIESEIFKFSSWICLDFEEMVKNGIDAIELHLSEEDFSAYKSFGDGLYYKLYGWDCDSILIMNPDIIIM